MPNQQRTPNPKYLGRRTRLTPELQQQLCAYIAAGNYASVACAAVGIAPKLIYDWAAKGRKPGAKECYREFGSALEKAEAQAHARSVAIIQKAALETWQAAAWWLERRYPEQWARRDTLRQEITGRGNEPLIFRVVYDALPSIAQAANRDALPQLMDGSDHEDNDKAG